MHTYKNSIKSNQGSSLCNSYHGNILYTVMERKREKESKYAGKGVARKSLVGMEKTAGGTDGLSVPHEA